MLRNDICVFELVVRAGNVNLRDDHRGNDVHMILQTTKEEKVMFIERE